MRRLKTLFGSLAAVALASGPALANTEIITTYDARSAGMAHTGTATIDNAAATFTNPANLTYIKNLDVTLHFSPGLTSAHTPYLSATNGPTNPAYATSKFILTPLAFAGVGFRLHPAVTVGLAGQITQVKGVTFEQTPLSINPTLSPTVYGAVSGSENAAQLFWEVRAPIAVDINKYLTVAAGYRMGFYHEGSKFTVDALPGEPAIKTSYHGQNFAGAMAGITLRPCKNLRLGLTYRSKMIVNGKGHLTVFNAQNGQTVSPPSGNTKRYASPHMFTFGAAYAALGNRLTVAGDFKYWMYKDAYGGQAYRDAMSGHVGAEYMVTPRVPLRAGYLIGLSAVRKDKAHAFDTSPGLQHGGTLGSGYHFNMVDLDGAVGFGGSNTHVAGQTTSLNGDYKLNAILLHVSATVHL